MQFLPHNPRIGHAESHCPIVRRRRITAALLAAAASLILATTGVASAQAAVVHITSFASGQCLQPNPFAPIGTPVEQMPCDNNPNDATYIAQSWASDSLGNNNYQLVNLSTGTCLDAHGGNRNNTPVDTWPCDGISNERWHVPLPIPSAAPTQITWTNGGRCLDSFASLHVYDCYRGDVTQLFLLQ